MGNKLKFRISSGLKNIIGKDLITDDYIAVFELVKNSYDAQAKNIRITIEADKITIADDGKGMSLQELEEKWLFVAYSAKRDGTEDKQQAEVEDSYRDKIQAKRHYAGAKGIGRFSCDRLGKFLTLITSKANSSKSEKIKVDWSKFEQDQNQVFQDVLIEHSTDRKKKADFPKTSPSGTILEISGLHSAWGRDRLKKLKHSLEKLINPFSEVKNFSIEIVCLAELKEDKALDEEGKPKHILRNQINGKVQNSILEILELKTTQISVQFSDLEIETKIFDRGTPIYHIKEKNKDYKLLSKVNIDLYYLNHAAKTNFKLRMGLQVVRFGSVFLFKNGFRVQPFGEKGDDSWGLDFRAQQGFSRFLGTRELFGKVEIVTDNTSQFKEVSSRDGGLVETEGYQQLIKAFKEKGLIRLERYVVGVLWGEGFRKRKYFGDDDIAKERAESYREELKKDKETTDVSLAKSNLGSKIDFIQIIKSLATNKDVEIISYDKDLINLVNDRIDELQPKFISDLEKIADQTNDNELKQSVQKVEKRYKDIFLAKEKAEKDALEAEERQRIAEQKAVKAEQEKLEAIEREKVEKGLRRLAEIKAKEEEQKKKDAELREREALQNKIAAEQKQREAELETEKERINAENERFARKKVEGELSIERDKTTFLTSKSRRISDDADGLVHNIKLSTENIENILQFLFSGIQDNDLSNDDLIRKLSSLRLNNEKVLKISKLITRANFKQHSEKQKIEIAAYIEQYVSIYRDIFESSQMQFEIDLAGSAKWKKVSALEISIIIDDLISNSEKAGAHKILFKISGGKKSSMKIIISDDGKGVPDLYVQNPEGMFEPGVTSTSGSGLGLYTVREILGRMQGEVRFLGNGLGLGGANFEIIIN